MSLATNNQIIKAIGENQYYPVGCYMITTKNVNPNTLGVKGTWELKRKKLDKHKVESLSIFTWASTTTPAVEVLHCDGDIIVCSIYVRTSQTLSDTRITLGTFNIDAIGSTILTSVTACTGWLHTIGACHVYVQALSASLRNASICIDEVYHRSGTRSFTSSSNIIFEFPIILSGGSLLYNDDMCNEFFWLRTA